MPENEITPSPAISTKPGAGFRTAGVIILLIGLVSAGLVYWLSTPAEVLPDELATPENNKKAARSIETDFGKMGDFSYALGEDLKDPLNRAAIVAIASILAASGCFYIAHLQDRDPHAHRPPAGT